MPPEFADLGDLGDLGDQEAAGAPHRGSSLRGLFLNWLPAGVAPLLWAYATLPERLGWTSQISSRMFSLLSPIYDEVTASPGYGEALELALLDLRGSPQRILDVGTGTGFVAERLKRRYPQAEVMGVDVSAEMVTVAQHNAAHKGLDITFQVGDAAKLAFQDASFDLVITQNAPPLCDEMLRVLKPRGKALIVFSFGGPWVELTWSTLAERLERSGASNVKGRRGGFGFYGIARKRA